jgi:hypothetical protein
MDAKSIDFAAIPHTALKVVTSPAAFFREMPKTGGFVEPLVFMVIMSVISGVLGGLLHALTNILGLHLYAGVAMGFLSIVMMPVLAAIGSAIFGFIAAGILFVIWKLMGSNEDYETAYRCTAYLAAVTPITTFLGIIPYVGGALGLVVMLYYLVTASVATQSIPSRKAWMVFGIITAVFVVLSVSAQIAARRFERNMEQASESWKDASKEMQKAAEEMQKRMKEEMEKQKVPAEPSK